jgi:hypothetical protein
MTKINPIYSDLQAMHKRLIAINEHDTGEQHVHDMPPMMGSDDYEDNRDEVIVGDYKTRHFDICPGATSLYKHLSIESNELLERTAKLHDVLFYLEKDPDRAHTTEDAVMAQIVADQIMDMAGMLGLETEHDYIQGHVDVIVSRCTID